LEAVLRAGLGSTELGTLYAAGAALMPRDALALALGALYETRADNEQLLE